MLRPEITKFGERDMCVIAHNSFNIGKEQHRGCRRAWQEHTQKACNRSPSVELRIANHDSLVK